MKSLLIYLFMIALALTAGWAFGEIKKKGTEENPIWCLVEDIGWEGGSFTGTGPGSHKYFIVSTPSGFKVYEQCE